MTDKEQDNEQELQMSGLSGLLELLKAIEELEEDEPCSICDRIILCGVDELCKLDPCGLKGK
jgi:hypothetical protein